MFSYGERLGQCQASLNLRRRKPGKRLHQGLPNQDMFSPAWLHEKHTHTLRFSNPKQNSHTQTINTMRRKLNEKIIKSPNVPICPIIRFNNSSAENSVTLSIVQKKKKENK